MRLTIRKKKRYRKKQNTKALIGLFVLAPVVSIVGGWMLTKTLILPYINSQGKATKAPIEKVQASKDDNLVLTSMEVYNMEIDRFQSIEEARKFVKKLNEEGILAYVSQNQEFIVYTSLTLNKEKINLQKDLIQKKYPQGQLKRVKTKEKEIKVGSSEEVILSTMKKTVKLLNESYGNELDIWIGDIKSTNYSELKVSMDKNNKALNESMTTYSTYLKSHDLENEDLKKLYTAIEETVKNREKITSQFNPNKEDSIKDTYYEFVKSLFTYINYYKI